ncbi:dermonecrotic toxin domain-containing protein [Pseudomonas sp. NPDC087336]|uniref:dermonecrotic toxin domain-containing protein n=1 Tax=Pseudomonas sp. NPDC087336 TaxID=3364436 RepID=UPI00380A39F9
MNDSSQNVAGAADTSTTPKMRNELKAVLDVTLPQTPSQFGEHLIKGKWGQGIDPQTAMLVTLDYNYKGHPARDGVQQGQVASSQSLLQALLLNHQAVGDGRFAENAFGLYTPPETGPSVQIVQNVDEFADHGSGNHQTYEGIYRRTIPQTYGPLTQISVRPADFKKWVWELDLQAVYKTYLDQAWPSDEVVVGTASCALRTSAKAAFVMTAWLQRHELRLSEKGLALAMQAAGLPVDQPWETLKIEQLQAPTRMPPKVKASRLKLYRYTATDIWVFRGAASDRVLVYIPGNSSPLHEFTDVSQLHQWVVKQGSAEDTKQALASHFTEDDRQDGTFHAGVLTALDGMAMYPKKHWLTNNAGFFNNDGYWDPADYIGFDDQAPETDPFAQLVLAMKRAARNSATTIRDDAQVNRDNLSAVVEPIVQWVNLFGPLALFVPGGEGVLALAGLIDAGYGLDQAINGDTADKRSQGITRTVFGVLNALPLFAEAASIGHAGAGEEGSFKVGEGARESSKPSEAGPVSGADISQAPVLPLPSRTDLLRGIGAPAGTFSDEVLAQIARVSAVDDDMLRLMQAGRAPTPLLADTIDRFRIDQEVAGLADSPAARAQLFDRRYQQLQKTENEWVRLFQREYPDLPTAAVEQMLDRYGVDLTALPDVIEAKRLFSQLDSKARQYQQHVRLNRAYEGLYLRSVANPESHCLALHSLKNLPGWPEGLRIEVREGSIVGRLLDRSGPLDTTDCRTVIRSGEGYLHNGLSTQPDFYEAVVEILSGDECSALGLTSKTPAAQLEVKVNDRLLSRSELALGLARMDSRLSFEPQGLRGGAFPGTVQNEGLTHHMMRLHLKEIYPEFSNEDADLLIQQLGGDVLAHISSVNLQMQQLHVDMDTWMMQVWVDVYHTDIPFLRAGEPEAAGLTVRQIALHNFDLLQRTAASEQHTRQELADELIAIFQKRDPQQGSNYSGNHTQGFTMNMSHEDYYRLPELNVRFNDVVNLNLQHFHLMERQTLNGFFESFPNLRILNLQDTDLRLPNVNGQLESVLPPVIPQLQHLTSLNLRSTHLTFSENTAGQLSQLVNLQALDLSDNPLDIPPVVLGMNQLRSLNLRNTRITRCPVGIMDQPYLTTLDLRDNQIQRVPQAVLDQAIAPDRVLLWNNPLTDEDTLQRLVTHRQQTGINLWLSAPRPEYSEPTVWLAGIEAQQSGPLLQVWHSVALKPRGMRLLGTVNTLTLTPDFLVNYPDLQARVWQLLAQADAWDGLWDQLTLNPPMPGGAFNNPIAVFSALEDRARLYANWVAMGQPFPVAEH